MSHLPPDSSSSPSEPNNGIRQQANNTLMSGGMQAVQGDNNVQIQGDNNSVFNYFQNLFLGKQESSTPRPRNEQLLLTQVKQEVASRLKQSLRNAILINLGKEEQLEQVQPPLAVEIKVGSRPAHQLADNTTILQVFDQEDFNGRLLVLGQPGAGKTTTLLELAKALVERAEKQIDYPIPILLSLSSWKDPHKPIVDWLIEELKSKYGVRKDIGKKWIDEKQLLPLLDGLDEVKPEFQKFCIQAINQWMKGKNRSLYLVVCSRSEEYNANEELLELSGAILLKTLKSRQVHEYLININQEDLWHQLQQDKELLKLVHTPLWLSIVILSFKEIPTVQLQWTSSTAKRLELLLDAYVQQMLHRQLNSIVYKTRKQPSSKQTKKWLGYLAQRMQKDSQTEFLIEKMQPVWLENSNRKRLYGLLLGAIAGVPTWLSTSLILKWSLEINISSISKKIDLSTLLLDSKSRLLAMLVMGLLPGLFVILFVSLTSLSTEIKPVETLAWSWEKARKTFATIIFKGMNIELDGVNLPILWGSIIGIVGFIIIGLSNGLFVGILAGLSIGFLAWLILGLIPGLVFGLFLGLFAGLSSSEIRIRKYPNQGIYQSAINALTILLLGTLLGAIFGCLLGSIFNGLLPGISFGITLGFFAGLLFTLFGVGEGDTGKAGWSFIQHIILRLILFCDKLIPWNYARFLDYCTERMILQRVGGGYRFIHKLLQDHFASMELK